MRRTLTKLLGLTIMLLVPGLGLIAASAPATLECRREAGRVDGTIRRHIFFGLLQVERLEVTGIREARLERLGRHAWVELDTDEGDVRLTRVPANTNDAGPVVSRVNEFLTAPDESTLALEQEMGFGVLNMFGYIFLVFYLLAAPTAFHSAAPAQDEQ